MKSAEIRLNGRQPFFNGNLKMCCVLFTPPGGGGGLGAAAIDHVILRKSLERVSVCTLKFKYSIQNEWK